MSLYLAPEAVATVTPPIVVRPMQPRPDTRPVESADKSNAGASDQKHQRQDSTVLDKPTPSNRPPGTVPEQPPQSLFEASLISTDFKPTTRPAESQKAPPEETAPEPASAETSSASETGERTSAAASQPEANPAPEATTSTTSAQQHQVEQAAAASYGAGGTRLSLPSTANPDFLGSVEKIV